MHVASLELCKTLHELSGWGWSKRTGFTTYNYHESGKATISGNAAKSVVCPAYDLGYLLRKLPKSVGTQPKLSIAFTDTIYQKYYAQYWAMGIGKYLQEADTPEDAACLLAIALFEQGILTREGSNE